MQHLTHVEVSIEIGTLDAGFETDLDRLLHDVFGWVGTTATDSGPGSGATRSRTYRMPTQTRLVLRERNEALRPGIDDHLGFTVDAAELDRLVVAAVALATDDARVSLKYMDGDRPTTVDAGDFWFQTFFVRFLLPVWFQFESYCPNEHPPV